MCWRLICKRRASRQSVAQRGRLTRDAAQLGTEFLGVLLNPPWVSVTPKQIEGLALPKLCPVGFIFVWVEKEVLDQVVDVLVQQKYVYVENLTWVLMTANNRVRARVACLVVERAAADGGATPAGGAGGSPLHWALAPHAPHLSSRRARVSQGQGNRASPPAQPGRGSADRKLCRRHVPAANLRCRYCVS